jgi:hypothetical protein
MVPSAEVYRYFEHDVFGVFGISASEDAAEEIGGGRL